MADTGTVYAQPGELVRLFLEDAPPGLVGTLTVKVTDVTTDTDVVAATSSGIEETRTGQTSTYTIQITAPATVSDDYLIDWDLDGENHTTAPLEVTLTPPVVADLNSPLAPSVADVATLLRWRTVDENGRKVGTFNDYTDPTYDETRNLILDAIRDVRRKAGPEIETSTDDDLVDSARRLVAIRAAMLVLIGNDPDQYDRFSAMWDDDLAGLLSTLRTDPADTQGYGPVPIASPTNAAYMDQLAGFDPWLPPAV
jgi:hypothetical protein